MKALYMTIVLFLIFNMLSFSSDTYEFNKQKLKENGVTITEKVFNFTDHQFYLLETYDFTPFRNLNSNRIVQIEDGPLIQLFSLNEMIKSGKTISSEILENKKEEIHSDHLKKVITLINIGFKYGPVYNTETGF